ncbi:AAA domain-containing protein, putative AbiEii toxin, Type IV TA system [Aquipseudomonas alcaligenes]|uniref:AAA family ATPase n=1 Tax=Aquipseudomonas alcaligenes TaxID=43263 RepID=UPI00095490F9|nr:ATP-binding protein [Pseudomonas alcaligenes]SIS21648.1 AAA domain-containing protein, putative AbiEii toxin, Type IV TA system [Pseudomonas alcaligenes]
MITNLQLKNFTAFTDLAIDFSPGINIIIGENGTGKTQLLKSILALCGQEAYVEQAGDKLAGKLCRLYHPLTGQVGELRRAGTRGDAVLRATFASGQEITARFNGTARQVKVSTSAGGDIAAANFIPTKEVLSLVRGLTAEQPDQPTIERIFDDGYLDLARQLIKEGADDLDAKVKLDPRFASIVPRLANLIGGRYELHEGRFCFQAGEYVEKRGKSSSEHKAPQSFQDSEMYFVPAKSRLLSSTMTAEGFRKIGVLQRLLSNGSLNPGTAGPLLWDEPESNLNPKLMKDLVLALLELARNGQQVILATHDYVLLKWFDLLLDKGKGDQVRFHVLSRQTESGQVLRDSMDDYRAIEPNAIAETFNELTKEQVARKMGGLGK